MTYEEVALEEIKNDYPKAYEILKKALPDKFTPYCTEIRATDLQGNTSISKSKNLGGSLCLQGFGIDCFTSEEGYDQGVLKIGLNTYKLTNIIAMNKEKHQLNFTIEKLEVL